MFGMVFVLENGDFTASAYKAHKVQVMNPVERQFPINRIFSKKENNKKQTNKTIVLKTDLQPLMAVCK